MGCQAHTDYQKLEQSTPLYWCPLNILLLKFCSDRGVTSLRESQSHPCCENIQRNDEIPFIPSHWAWIHHYTIFKHFSQLFFFEKMWSNLRRQMIRWSITSALPNYWLGHKEGRKVGFCQILYIWHLFKVCLMYFLCMSSHSFVQAPEGDILPKQKWCLGPKYLGGIPFFLSKTYPKNCQLWNGILLGDDWFKSWRYLSFVNILLRQADMLCLKI